MLGTFDWFRMLDTEQADRVDAKWARLANAANLTPYGYDEFGFSPRAVRQTLPLVWLLYSKYFRVDTHDIDRVPAGRVLLIANHSGQLPFDGMMIASSLIFDADPPRIVRSMVERWVPTLPFVSTFFTRCGQILGTPDNCRRLLNAEEAILVFPEGARGITKLYRDRYRLQRFGSGFMRLAMQTGTPICPVAVIGAEEQQPALANLESVARVLGLPAFPITPTFPWLGPAGLLPGPSKYDLYFGEPLRFPDHSKEDDTTVRKSVERVKGSLEELVATGRAARKGFWR